MQVVFPNPQEVIVIPETKQLLSGLNVICVNDFPDRKLVQAQIQEIGMVVLWKDAEYDQIGQWTDNDVINRIIELYA
jgi:hypothetical protein